jgi:hypothetical protein
MSLSVRSICWGLLRRQAHWWGLLCKAGLSRPCNTGCHLCVGRWHRRPRPELCLVCCNASPGQPVRSLLAVCWHRSWAHVCLVAAALLLCAFAQPFVVTRGTDIGWRRLTQGCGSLAGACQECAPGTVLAATPDTRHNVRLGFHTTCSACRLPASRA